MARETASDTFIYYFCDKHRYNDFGDTTTVALKTLKVRREKIVYLALSLQMMQGYDQHIWVRFCYTQFGAKLPTHSAICERDLEENR